MSAPRVVIFELLRDKMAPEVRISEEKMATPRRSPAVVSQLVR